MLTRNVKMTKKKEPTEAQLAAEAKRAAKEAAKAAKEAAKLKAEKEFSQKKKDMLKAYAQLRKKKRTDLSMEDFTSGTSYTKDMLRHHWGSITKIDAEARDKYPKCFMDVYIEDVMTEDALEHLRETVRTNDKFVITTAVTGCLLDVKAYNSIKQYCKLNKAALLVLVASDPASNLDRGSLGRIDKRLLGEAIIFEDTHLNSNLFLSTIKLSAKQVDPITGIGRIGQREGSFIYASPKQRMKSSPVSNIKMPHFLMTTGAITEPDYLNVSYMSNRTAVIATHDHVMGGLIVEIGDSDEYHFRQFQCDNKGNFIDLGKEYNGKTVKDIRPEAFVLGDWHAGSTCPMSKKVWKEISKSLNPKYVVMHDMFDGRSINHHESQNIDSLAKRAASGHLNLDEELKHVARDLEELSTWAEKTVVVKSNHDEFLKRFLQKGDFAGDPYNYKTFLKLALEYVETSCDPLKYGVEKLGELDAKIAKNVIWLQRDEDFKVDGIQLGAHGDKGANGSRGGLKQMEFAYGNSVSGHSHSPEILRGAWQVGTSSKLKLSYNVGPSSWLNTSCIVYPNGQRQLINAIDGKYKI